MRTHVALATWAMLCVAPAAAHAKANPDVAAVTKLLHEQVDHFADSSGNSFLERFAPDGLLMTGSGVTSEPDERSTMISEAYFESVDAPGRSKLAKPLVGVRGDLAWASCDFVIHYFGYSGDGSKAKGSDDTLRLTELLRRDEGEWYVAAAHLSRPMKTADAVKYASDGGELDPIPGASAALADLATNPAALAASLAADPAVVVIGGEAKEKGAGAKAAAKLAQSWKSAKFELIGKALEVRDAAGNGYLAAHVRIRFKYGGKMVAVPFRVLVVFAVRNGKTEVLSAHYAS